MTKFTNESTHLESLTIKLTSNFNVVILKIDGETSLLPENCKLHKKIVEKSRALKIISSSGSTPTNKSKKINKST